MENGEPLFDLLAGIRIEGDSDSESDTESTDDESSDDK